MVTENARMRQLRDTEANWTTADPVLLDGEIAVSSDVNRIKVGDGTSAWSALPYYGQITVPSDGNFYGYENGNPALGVAWKDYEGSLNDINYPNGTLVRLGQAVSDVWPNFTPGNDYVLHMDNGAGGKVQIGYASPLSGGVLPVMHSRYYDGTWSNWITQVSYQAVPTAADLNMYNLGAGWQATVPLDDGVVNGPPNVGSGSILTHTQRATNEATQYVFDMTDPSVPKLWIREHDAINSWSDWTAIGGRDIPMVWTGNWVAGQYERGEVVYDTGFLMVANKSTSDRPAPQGEGDNYYLYAGASPTAQVTAKQVVMGQRFTVPSDGTARRLSKYRVNTTIGNNYIVYSVANVGTGSEVLTELAEFTGFVDGWTEFNINPILIQSGIVFDLIVVVQEPDPSPTVLTYNYNYATPGGGGGTDPVPTTGQIAHGSNTTDLISIHYTDNDGQNRQAVLDAISVGDIIEGAGQRWAVQGTNPRGTYITFIVAPSSQGAPDGVQAFNFETVTATPITHVEDVNYFDAVNDPEGVVQGLFGADIGYGDIVPDENAYGVDIEVETVQSSADWDFMAYTPNSDFAGGSDSDAGNATITVGSSFPTSPQPAAMHYLTEEPVGLYIYYQDVDSAQWVQSNGGDTDGEVVNEFHDPTGVASWRIMGETLECWGTTSLSGTVTPVSLPKTFAIPPSVQSTVERNGGVNDNAMLNPRNITVSDFEVTGNRADGVQLASGPFSWHAIGKWDGVS